MRVVIFYQDYVLCSNGVVRRYNYSVSNEPIKFNYGQYYVNTRSDATSIYVGTYIYVTHDKSISAYDFDGTFISTTNYSFLTTNAIKSEYGSYLLDSSYIWRSDGAISYTLPSEMKPPISGRFGETDYLTWNYADSWIGIWYCIIPRTKWMIATSSKIFHCVIGSSGVESIREFDVSPIVINGFTDMSFGNFLPFTTMIERTDLDQSVQAYGSMW